MRCLARIHDSLGGAEHVEIVTPFMLGMLKQQHRPPTEEGSSRIIISPAHRYV